MNISQFLAEQNEILKAKVTNFFFTKAYSFENTYSCCNSEFLSYFIKSVTEIKLFVKWVYKRTINYVENGKVIRQNGKTVTVG